VRRADPPRLRAQFLPPADRAAPARDLPGRVLEEAGEAESATATWRGIPPPVRGAVARGQRGVRRLEAGRWTAGSRAWRACVARSGSGMRSGVSTSRDLDLLESGPRLRIGPSLLLLSARASDASLA